MIDHQRPTGKGKTQEETKREERGREDKDEVEKQTHRQLRLHDGWIGVNGFQPGTHVLPQGDIAADGMHVHLRGRQVVHVVELFLLAVRRFDCQVEGLHGRPHAGGKTKVSHEGKEQKIKGHGKRGLPASTNLGELKVDGSTDGESTALDLLDRILGKRALEMKKTSQRDLLREMGAELLEEGVVLLRSQKKKGCTCEHQMHASAEQERQRGKKEKGNTSAGGLECEFGRASVAALTSGCRRAWYSERDR